MRFIVEILHLNGGAASPSISYVFAHKASSIHMVREAMKAVLKSPEWPPEANAFRIVSDEGAELYRWPE